MEKLADIGLIGLAVMGENLVLNMESHGYTVAVFNRTTSKVDKFINVLGYQIPNFLEHKFQKNSQVIGKLISSIFLE